MTAVLLTIVLAPLLGAILAGLFGKQIGRAGAHTVTILGVAVAFVLSIWVFFQGGEPYNQTIYQWAVIDGVVMEIGFLVDNLTTMMMLVVTFVSLMVHVYTIGYMAEDPGYQRFFSYISLFTFSMLMLVMSNNFLQLFFGWEAVGLVSYLLIGFWFKKPTAVYANMKAFLVNRVGDFGFLLGIALVLFFADSLNYVEVFQRLEADRLGQESPAITTAMLPIFGGISAIDAMTFLLFVGAMGKSAQVPLHVWLPDSMEGPTPISALIHAATMVTAGIFMVSRLSPVFEMSDFTLNMILIIGATTAFFMGLIGIVQNDIKRVVAYSTLSQLGYMTVALGASAYSAAVFHLMTHAFFKALLFLGAGSVIIAMHHEQDMRKMGGLRKYMPITYITGLIGSLALIGFPGLAGFFSKDLIIVAVQYSELPAAKYAYVLVLLGVFVTAFYSFRMFFLVFHGQPRMDEHTKEHLHETPWVVTVPLILLAIPSVLAGYFLDPMVMGDFFSQVIGTGEQGVINTIMVNAAAHPSIKELQDHYHGVLPFITHGLVTLPFWFAIGGLGLAAFIYLRNPGIATWAYERFKPIHTLLDRKYYLDDFNQAVFANGAINLGRGLWSLFETVVIDGMVVNGVAKVIGFGAGIVRQVQTGMMFHYAFSMVIGVMLMLAWMLFVFAGQGLS